MREFQGSTKNVISLKSSFLLEFLRRILLKDNLLLVSTGGLDLQKQKQKQKRKLIRDCGKEASIEIDGGLVSFEKLTEFLIWNVLSAETDR